LEGSKLDQVFDLADVTGLDLFVEDAEPVTWQGRRSLRIKNGLALVRGVVSGDASLELDLGVEAGPAYPGIAFRAADSRNYELVYVQPHTSGGWDAVQYDPVFNGGNTWQVFNGPRYQAAGEVPSGRYITLRLDLCGDRAGVSIIDPAGGSQTDRGPVLAIARLAHRRPRGRLGVWTFRPAYFAQMRVGEVDRSRLGTPAAPPPLPDDLVRTWLLRGVGPVEVEENGTLNLGRYLADVKEAHLEREFAASGPAEVKVSFGFSDEIELLVDGARVFTGVNTWSDGDTRQSRGYIELASNVARVPVGPGRHSIEAILRSLEPFGWGMALALSGLGVKQLPISGAITNGRLASRRGPSASQALGEGEEG